jgi:precorrin-6x reductase
MDKHVLVFGGTSEGRTIIQKLVERNICVTASSLTEYGNDQLIEHSLLTKRFGALNTEQMRTLIVDNSYDAVIDATHPYAEEISNHISQACKKQKIRLFRLERKKALKADEGLHFGTIQEACSYLKNKSGKILFTTGSNRIPEIVKILSKDRLIFRILPIKRSLDVAKVANIKESNLLPLNPPFSIKDNVEHIKKHKVKYLVTKDSGINGGCLEKMEAIRETNIELIIIDRPMNIYDTVYYSDEKIIEEIIR